MAMIQHIHDKQVYNYSLICPVDILFCINFAFCEERVFKWSHHHFVETLLQTVHWPIHIGRPCERELLTTGILAAPSNECEPLMLLPGPSRYGSHGGMGSKEGRIPVVWCVCHPRNKTAQPAGIALGMTWLPSTTPPALLQLNIECRETGRKEGEEAYTKRRACMTRHGDVPLEKKPFILWQNPFLCSSNVAANISLHSVMVW